MPKFTLPAAVPEPYHTPPRLGAVVPGKGVYMGVWAPEQVPGRKFVVYAAPKDLTGDDGGKILLTYNEAVEEIARRRNWYGHDGVRLANSAEVYEALANGGHGGRWFIPPRELVDGRIEKLVDGEKRVEYDAYPNSLYQLRDKNAFKDTFDTRDYASASGYWSSSEYSCHGGYVWKVNFSDGYVNWTGRDLASFAVRPVRVEPLVV